MSVALFVKLVVADVDAVETLDELLRRGFILVFAVHELGGESEHVLVERDLGDVGGAGRQILLNRGRQQER